ncbi:SDR family NAD(P)-dependent oxidoreductase [Nocardioides sp. YIM 152315]|uniref:SDR family NAD(P)-dependent oxidoreductase n=1 Tax=Nocardioides sp. YIM 152315 TaxID=3031760 RepID=UPI0023DC8237|nr:SDR family NAD(P)-dependent oxidoreductase [Nocardioides sp. YIM 152315]MDF1604657.1 SDR family NAD(P)-dependent oxidoreductase [Nocardioides sp. YIM 152315]
MAEDQARISVVTGGALGIGGAITRRLARDGDHVVLVDVDETAAQETADEVRTAGGTATALVGDVTDQDTVDRIAAVVAGLGRVDVLVNNVGDFRPASKTFLHSTPAQWQRLHDLNFGHVLAVTHALLPRMVEQGGGAIVNSSTVEAFRGIPGHATYSGYNAAVSAFTRSLAIEVGRYGVRVNAIAPDLADTEQTPAAAMLRGRDAGQVPLWVPLGRFGRVEDYADVVAFLASDDARFVTGHTVPVDGGTLAASGWYAREDGKGWTNMPDHP